MLTLQFIMGNVFVSILTSGILVIIVLKVGNTWISERLKRSIENEYDIKLELFKSKLSSENSRELEKSKSELNLMSITHQIQYSTLHIERAKVIQTLYSKLDLLISVMHSLVKPMQLTGEKPIEEKQTEVINAGNDFDSYFKSNKIYFSAEICSLIGEIHLIIADGFHWFSHGYKNNQNPVSVQASQQYMDWQIQAWKNLESKVPILKDKLENEFRKILGVIK
jgi:hypothetical protein